MEFGHSEDQRQFGEALRRFLTDRVTMELRRGGDATALWAGLTELGVPGLLVPEEAGGAERPGATGSSRLLSGRPAGGLVISAGEPFACQPRGCSFASAVRRVSSAVRLSLPDGVGQVRHPRGGFRADRLQGHAARVHALEQADSGAEQHG